MMCTYNFPSSHHISSLWTSWFSLWEQTLLSVVLSCKFSLTPLLRYPISEKLDFYFFFLIPFKIPIVTTLALELIISQVSFLDGDLASVPGLSCIFSMLSFFTQLISIHKMKHQQFSMCHKRTFPSVLCHFQSSPTLELASLSWRQRLIITVSL